MERVPDTQLAERITRLIKEAEAEKAALHPAQQRKYGRILICYQHINSLECEQNGTAVELRRFHADCITAPNGTRR
jgi:hypothetical protein